ncbi:MAG: CTP synthase, partial [Candidatus Puniceispirillaceae bacterium]
IKAAGELKTKPTQHSVKELQSVGIQPDILMCRTEQDMPEEQRAKIGLFCNVREEAVILAEDVSNIYEVPLAYHKQGLDKQICRHFGLDYEAPDLSRWEQINHAIQNPEGEVNITIVGKYVSLQDSYKSLTEALSHGGIANRQKVNMTWLDSELLETDDDGVVASYLSNADAILVPGGFGERGSAGKIRAIQFAREKQVPYLGICFGMQMAVLETARNVAGITKASSTEFGQTNEPLVGLMTEWNIGNELTTRAEDDDLGGTMRLGAYDCVLEDGSLALSTYGEKEISERHRHRYEVNIGYRDMLEGAGMKMSGLSPDGRLPEIVERTDHPFFIAVQFHPELKSRPFEPHPLFSGFINAAKVRSRLV